MKSFKAFMWNATVVTLFAVATIVNWYFVVPSLMRQGSSSAFEMGVLLAVLNMCSIPFVRVFFKKVK